MERELRLRSGERLEARLTTVNYARGLNPRRAPASDRLGDGAPIWQFWASGAASAPPLIRRCLQSVAENSGPRPVIVLDADSYRDFAELSPQIEARREQIGWTHFSDLLRLSLLARHGGSWIDASVLLSAPIPHDLARLPFFAFTRPEDPFVLSSWFLQAVPAHPIVLALQTMLNAYWATNDELVDYFLLHFMFESAVTSNRQLRSMWTHTPALSFEPPVRLQAMLTDDFDPNRLDQVSSESWIHKLTWRLPPDADRPGSFATALAARGSR